MLMLNECGPIQGLIFRGGSGSFTGVFACGGLIVSSQSDVFAWFSVTITERIVYFASDFSESHPHTLTLAQIRATYSIRNTVS